MAIIQLPDSTPDLVYVVRFTRISDGAVWNGSDFVAISTLTSVALQSAVNGVTATAVKNDDDVHIEYQVTVPAEITVPVHASAYLTSYTANDEEEWGADYDPQVGQILEDTGTTLDGKLNTIDDFLDTEMAAVLAAVDIEVAAIKAKTDNLPTDPADQSAVETAISVVAGYIDTEVAAIKLVTDKIDTTLVQDGAVYDFTAAALAAAPTGGGTAPTADEVADAVLNELVTEHTTANSLGKTISSINTTVSTLSSGTGDGAYTVTLTISDIDGTVENVFVRVTLGATSYTGYTNADGEVAFSCDAGTWTVGMTGPGYNNFTPVELVVAGDTGATYTLTKATIADTFIVAQDLYDVFGESNVIEWANMESLSPEDTDYTSEITRRITAACTFATDEAKEFLRNGPYDEDFSIVPSSIRRFCCYKAGSWLFEWRRDLDDDNRYEKMEERADKIIEQIKRGARQLDSSQTIQGTRAPGVV